MSILSKWGFRAGNCGGTVHPPYPLIINTYQESSGYAPEAVANPRTPNSDSTFFGTLREGLAAGRRALKTRWELVVEKRMPLERGMTRETTRALAVAEVRMEIISQRSGSWSERYSIQAFGLQ
jgi:hypothetical protein